MTTRTQPSAETLRRVAQEYEAEGYRVILHPGPDSLPDFLGGLRPDLLARRNEQNVVVEIAVGPPDAEAAEVSEVARRVEGRSDWRFDLVRVPPAADTAFVSPDSLNYDEILVHLQTARALTEQGHTTAALLIAWSATEAALRLLAQDQAVRVDPAAPRELLRRLATAGVLEQESYAALVRGFDLRSKAAHGFRAGDAADFVSSLLRSSEMAQQQGSRNPIFPEPIADETFDLKVGGRYRRMEIHKRFGGSYQSGISVSRDYPLIFLFFGNHIEHPDSLSGDTAVFVGEGQVGDMQLQRGNRAILEHKHSGKQLHLFRYVQPGTVMYLGEYECVGYEHFVGLDRTDKMRKMIAFQLRRIGSGRDETWRSGVPAS